MATDHSTNPNNVLIISTFCCRGGGQGFWIITCQYD